MAVNEFDAIDHYFKPLSLQDANQHHYLNDAAVLSVPEGHELVVTKDVINENVHFFTDDSPRSIASKLIGSNLSDIASMGASPHAGFMALSLNASIDKRWLEEFSSSLLTYCREYNFPILGGDTTRSPGTLSLSMTAMGLIKKGQALLRTGAKAGDDIYITKTVGDAALGLKLLNNEISDTSPQDEEKLKNAYYYYRPDCFIGQIITEVATSCIDVSDGLIQDLGHLCNASSVGAIIDCKKLPLSGPVSRLLEQTPDLITTIVQGGDDYNLLFTVPNTQLLPKKIERLATKIGTITASKEVITKGFNGSPLEVNTKGYNHSLGS